MNNFLLPDPNKTIFQSTQILKKKKIKAISFSSNYNHDALVYDFEVA